MVHSMITTVTGKNQVSIPARIAEAHDIRPGCRLEWKQGSQPNTLTVTIHPDPAQVAKSMLGRGRRHLPQGGSAVEGLIEERRREAKARP